MATVTIDRASGIPAAEETEQKFQYPGIPTTCDGAEAVVWVETRICQGSGAYPITSSTTMGGGFNAAMMNGVPNLWGDQLVFVEPESEHSAATFCEGFALAGGRAVPRLPREPAGARPHPRCRRSDVPDHAAQRPARPRLPVRARACGGRIGTCAASRQSAA